ncbi:protein transport protein bet1 [Kickxella alabastrina]|uniref:Protein transport protein bet1 n=1 Tax=Kickxella alabastrina TaxID=61397 RepID=A0ACC1I7P9_9FUNG|nr:protein transport protein bet1 [Kickxella alabastrina]
MSAYSAHGANSNRLRHHTGGNGGYPNTPNPFQQYEQENDPNGKDSRLKNKIIMLKEVSINIGDEIRDQNQFLITVGDDMEGMGGRLKATMRHFNDMLARQGCGPFFYLTIFAIAVFVFLYMYLKAR